MPTREVARPIRLLLRLVLPERDLDSVLGDLAEHAPTSGRLRRTGWLLGQACSLLFWNLLDHRRRLHLPAKRSFMISNLWFELRAAARSLRRSPGFTAAVVATITIGIAGTTTVFALVNGVLLAPLDYPRPDRLVALWSQGSASPALFEDLRERMDSLEALAAWSGGARVLRDDRGPTLLLGPEVSAGFLATLGYSPVHGRLLRPADNEPGAAPVLLITHELFERRFGADPEVVGSTIVLDEEPWTIVGVLPPEAELLQADAEIVTPLTIDPASSNYEGGFYLNLIGRLADGVAIEQASAQLGSVARSLEGYSFSDDLLAESRVIPLQERIVGDRRPVLVLLLGAVALLLGIACVNVGNLNVARQLGRRQELAVRMALGGGRSRGTLFLAAESLLLALAGGGVGVLLSAWSLGAIRLADSLALPRLANVRLDATVIGFSLALTALVALVSGVVPGLRTGRLDPARALGSGRTMSEGRRAGRLREGLVVVEVALAVVLTAAAGLLGHSLWGLVNLDPGFEAEDRLLLQVVPPTQGPGQELDVDAYYERLIDGFGTLPSVIRVGSVHTAPVRGSGWVMTTRIEGVEVAEDEEPPLSYWRVVSPGYFEAIGARVRQGRPLAATDREGTPAVAVINATAAARYWPDDNPVGRRLRIGFDTDEWLTVVGVIEDIRLLGPTTDTPPTVYRPLSQGAAALERVGVTSQTLIVHTRGAPSAALPELRERLRDLDPGAPILAPAPLASILRDSLAEPRLLLQVIGLFGSAALVLATVGIAGVVGHLVRQRRRELGIRQALGARQAQVLRHCLGRGVALGGIGLTLGLLAALALAPLLAGFLHGVSPRDPLSLTAVVVLLALAVLAASWVPSRRVSRIQPSEALRSD